MEVSSSVPPHIQPPMAQVPRPIQELRLLQRRPHRLGRQVRVPNGPGPFAAALGHLPRISVATRRSAQRLRNPAKRHPLSGDRTSMD